MSGPSSVTLAVQALTRKQTRIGVLEEQVKKLEHGDPNAMSIVQALPESEFQQGEDQINLSEAQVQEKLSEFNFDLHNLPFATVYQQLRACSARALDRRAYESSKLIRAELDKLKGQVHSQNPEISDAAKKRRVVVQEELRALGEQQQRNNKDWAGQVKTFQLNRRGKMLETDSDFDLLCLACEAWFELQLKLEKDRRDQMLNACTSTLESIARRIADTWAVQGYSRVVAADNTLAAQRKTAFALAEQALMAVENVHAEQPAMVSPESAELTTARVAHARYAQQELCRKYESAAAQRLILGATVHCLGRMGVVAFLGHCALGEGIWVLVRLATSHGGEHPLVYTDGQTPLGVSTELKLQQRCAPEHALFAPAHAVHVATERSKFKVTRAVQHAALVIQSAFRQFQARKRTEESALRVPAEAKFCAADAIARAVGLKSYHVQDIANHFRATSQNLSQYSRARIAYVWIINNLKYLWYSEEQDVETILRDGGANALGLNLLYREQLQALGVDCCLVKGLHRLVGVDTVTGQSSATDNHVWAVVRVDRDRDGQTSADCDRYALVDVASSIGQWRGLRFESTPTPSWFDCDVEVFSSVAYPLSTQPSVRATAALHLFSATPTNTLTHLDPQPRPLAWGRFDVENSLITRPKFYEAGGRVLFPKQPNCGMYNTSRAYFTTAILLRKNIEVDVALLTVTSPLTTPSSPVFDRTDSRTTGCYSHVQYVPSTVKPTTHRVVYVTTIFSQPGTYCVELYMKSSLPAGTIPALKLLSIPVTTTTGVYTLRSAETVVAGYLLPLPVPSRFAPLQLLAPTHGYMDLSTPLHFELAQLEADDAMPVDEVIAAAGDDWARLHRFSIEQPGGGVRTVFKGSVCTQTTTQARIEVYARYKDGLSYQRVLARRGRNLQPPSILFDRYYSAFAAGLRFYTSNITPTSVLLALSTHAPRCLQAQLIRGTHTLPPKNPVSAGFATAKAVPLDIAVEAKTLAESLTDSESESLRTTVSAALLAANSDPSDFLTHNPRIQDLLWLVSCSVQEARDSDGACTVLLYTSAKPGGVLTFAAAYPVVVPRKQ